MSNPDFPWFRFYVREWLTDARVRAMSLAARGAYIDLLCFQWENGSIPEDLAAIARLLGATLVELEEVWPQVGSRFRPARGGGLQNPRLEKERIANQRRRNRRSDAARTSRPSRQNSAKKCSPEVRETTHVAEQCYSTSRARASSDADADADADEEKRVDSKSTPAPPVSNPSPPKPRTRWQDFVTGWNELAAAENLQAIRGTLSEGRKRKARNVIAAMRRRGDDWFEVLAGAVRDRRGTWARENRFPTLDQALREEIVDKLAEGFYERDRQASSGQPAHLDRQSDFKATTGPTRVTIIRPEDRR